MMNHADIVKKGARRFAILVSSNSRNLVRISAESIDRIDRFLKAAESGTATAGPRGVGIWKDASFTLELMTPEEAQFLSEYHQALEALASQQGPPSRRDRLGGSVGRPKKLTSEPNTKRLQVMLPADVWERVEAAGGPKAARKVLEEAFRCS